MSAPGTTSSVHPRVLNTYHRNPRRGDTALIAGSLRAHGQYRPLVVNVGTHTGRPNEVLAGNHTLAAFRDLAQSHPDDPRWDSVLVHWVDVDEDRAKRIVVADNRTAELGGMDHGDLFSLLGDLSDLDGTGYDQAYLDMLAELDSGPPDPVVPDAPPAAPVDDGTERLRIMVPSELARRWKAHRTGYPDDESALLAALARVSR